MKAIINAYIVTMNKKFDVYKSGYIVIDNSKIVDINDMEHFSDNDYEIIDAKGKICIPGLINAHTHLGLVPFRSMNDDTPDRLRKIIFPLEQKFMSKQLVALSSEYAAYESLLNGVTTVADMYYYSDEVAKVLSNVKIRALVGQTIIDESQIDITENKEILKETEEFIKKWKSHKLVQPMIAPHGTVTVNKDDLVAISELSRKYDVKVMMHVSEMEYEYDYLHPSTPFEYLENLGVLNGNFIAVHAILTNDNDHRIISDNGVSIVHCPIANMKSGKGIASIHEMQQIGINCALGTDGPISSNDLGLVEVMKVAAISQKAKYKKREIMSAKKMMAMATINGAKALGLEKHCGSLEVNKEADIVLLSDNSLHMFPIFDVYSTLLYQLQSSDISLVMVAGNILIENKKVINCDVNNLRQRLIKEMDIITSNYNEIASQYKL